jgi:hypothetical protein
VITEQEIKELKTYYIEDLYSNVRKEQKTDQAYFDDTFEVPEVRDPHRIYRSGIGAKMVDAPAEQIITSNPQANWVGSNKEIVIRLSREINQNWLPILRRQNPNPFKETLKNPLRRGEVYIKLAHNEAWVTGKKERKGLPVFFIIPDPMVIYGSPEEDENGIPLRVIVFYERQARDLILRYPHWTDPKNKVGRKRDSEVEWLEYWDKDVRYFEADGEPVLKGGIQENPYKLVPFIRKYSGFGTRSPDGELSNLIVSDIKMSRDLIRQECATRSNIASIEALFAHKSKLIMSPGAIDRKQIEELKFGAYTFNVLENLPADTELVKEDVQAVPPEMYASLTNIRSEIAQRNPFIMAGFPFGASGRQQSMSEVAAFRRYDTVIENNELAWGTAFETAMKICAAIPTLKPDVLHDSDLKTDYKCKVALRAKDPIEEDRLITMGDRLRRDPNPAIDLETFHTEYLGYTLEKSQEVMARMMAERLMLSPDAGGILKAIFEQESGLEQILAQLQEKGQVPTPMSAPQIPPTTQERNLGEVQTPLGAEQAPMGGIGARQPPRRYTRG